MLVFMWNKPWHKLLGIVCSDCYCTAVCGRGHELWSGPVTFVCRAEMMAGVRGVQGVTV